MTEEEKVAFWKAVQCTVEKDVVRTDRCHPYFSGDGNPNIDILKYVLPVLSAALVLMLFSQSQSLLICCLGVLPKL